MLEEITSSSRPVTNTRLEPAIRLTQLVPLLPLRDRVLVRVGSELQTRINDWLVDERPTRVDAVVNCIEILDVVVAW